MSAAKPLKIAYRDDRSSERIYNAQHALESGREVRTYIRARTYYYYYYKYPCQGWFKCRAFHYFGSRIALNHVGKLVFERLNDDDGDGDDDCDDDDDDDDDDRIKMLEEETVIVRYIDRTMGTVARLPAQVAFPDAFAFTAV
jgi:hypothetical protein